MLRIVPLYLLAAITAAAFSLPVGARGVDAHEAVERLNRQFLEAGRRQDDAAVMNLWADDGVDLLPGMQPLVGKAAIASWLEGISKRFHGTKVTRYEIHFEKIQINGDWAYEWGTSEETIVDPNGKTFENPGKITLILHRNAHGQWKLYEEMWNSSPRTAASGKR
ncbi:MAG: SgcJ/EcaC family oxidoreductase [Acidobacteriota bacterium]|nr:SgcJ/EcaC family oxidoreductase [Acidobacteriota bacterium]